MWLLHKFSVMFVNSDVSWCCVCFPSLKQSHTVPADWCLTGFLWFVRVFSVLLFPARYFVGEGKVTLCHTPLVVTAKISDTPFSFSLAALFGVYSCRRTGITDVQLQLWILVQLTLGLTKSKLSSSVCSGSSWLQRCRFEHLCHSNKGICEPLG